MKTADLIGTPLDWAVAQCEGKTHGYRHQLVDDCRHYVPYSPSTDWSHGGPIIERENIWLTHNVAAKRHGAHKGDDCWFQSGPTPLIAACRCFVASRLGDEVAIPEELLK